MLGKGAFANVFKGSLLSDPQRVFAIKEIDHNKLTEKAREALFKEIEIHKLIDNPAIVRLYSVRRTIHHYYLILEYCEGKDLFSYLRTKKKLSEEEVQFIMHSLMPAFQYLYSNKILHRDIKLKNILRATSKENSAVKLCDFGAARSFIH